MAMSGEFVGIPQGLSLVVRFVIGAKVKVRVRTGRLVLTVEE